MHPSVRALLAAERCTDPVAAIRRRARALVEEALGLGWDGPPFDMTELASLRGLKVTASATLAADQDACVMPGQVLLNVRRPRVRQRYSVAHEVGHTLFPDYEAELGRVGRLWRRDGDVPEFERLCQAAGAEFLLPLNAFRAAVEHRGMSIGAAVAIATDFDASLEAAVRRLAETAVHPVAVVELRPCDPDTGTWMDVRAADGHRPYAPLAVSNVHASEACGTACFPVGGRPPNGGAADRAWKRVALAKGAVIIEQRAQECWEHAGVDGAWVSEAVTLPKGAAVPHEVLCLLRRAGGPPGPPA